MSCFHKTHVHIDRKDRVHDKSGRHLPPGPESYIRARLGMSNEGATQANDENEYAKHPVHETAKLIRYLLFRSLSGKEAVTFSHTIGVI